MTHHWWRSCCYIFAAKVWSKNDQFVDWMTFCLYFCSVKLVLKGIGRGGLGEKMYSAHSLNENLPQAVELNSTDSPTLTSVKELVLQMTAYDAKERPSSNNVLRTVQSIYQKVGEIEWRLSPPIKGCLITDFICSACAADVTVMKSFSKRIFKTFEF